MAFLYVFNTYSCRLSETQVSYGMVVSAREVLYLSTTLGGVLACPSYLLLDISTVWAEAETKWSAIARVAMYVLTPHNYAALCLATRFSERGFPRNPHHRKKVAALGCFTCCSAGPVFWLLAAATHSDGSDGRSSAEYAISRVFLATAWLPLMFGLFLFVIIYRRKRSAGSEVEESDLELQELGRDAAFGRLTVEFQVHRGRWFSIESADPVGFRWGPGMDSAGVVIAEYNGPRATQHGMEVTAAPGELLYTLSDDPNDPDEPDSPEGWVRTEMGLWLPTSVLAPVPQTIPRATLDVSRAHHRLKVKQQLPKHFVVRMALLEAQVKRRWQAQQERQSKGTLSHAFLALALVQVFADFCSCFALGELLEVGTQLGPTGAPSALRWGYGITSSGFLLLFGPASVVALFRRAATPKWELEDGWSAEWGDKLNRAVVACMGCIMLVGLVYVLVGAGLLAAGNDIFCTGYIGILKWTGPRNQAEWASTCAGYHAECVAGSCQVLPGVSPKELEALVKLKASGGLVSAKALSSWTGDFPCAGWRGVICSQSPQIAVRELDLGGIPLGTGNSTNVSTLAGLVHLTRLNLSNTRVVGDVGTLSPLTNLSSLDVSGTSVTARTPTAQVDALRAFKASMGWTDRLVMLDSVSVVPQHIYSTWTGDKPCGLYTAGIRANDPNHYEKPWYGITCNLVGKVPSGGVLYGGSITGLKLTCGDIRCGLNYNDTVRNPCSTECPRKLDKDCPAGQRCIGYAHHAFVTPSAIMRVAARLHDA
jgi:hypothetical protein